MLLGPSYFAWCYIHVGGSVFVSRKQIGDYLSLCICSVCGILIEVLYLSGPRTASYVSCIWCYKSHLSNTCLVFVVVSAVH